MLELPPLHQPIRVSWKLAVGRKAQLDADAVAKLRFREVNPSEAFTLLDSEGGYFRAQLLSLGSKGGEALVYEELPHPTESELQITLVCAVLARQRMLQVVQKATELGAQLILPVLTEHSLKAEGLEHEKAHAWPKQAVRAARQCRRAIVPVVRPAAPLAEVLQGPAWTGAGVRLFMDDRAAETVRLHSHTIAAKKAKGLCLATGPEGGWSDAERELLLQASARPLLLGGRVLRAETAVLVGLALVQHRLGDLTA